MPRQRAFRWLVEQTVDTLPVIEPEVAHGCRLRLVKHKMWGVEELTDYPL